MQNTQEAIIYFHQTCCQLVMHIEGIQASVSRRKLLTSGRHREFLGSASCHCGHRNPRRLLLGAAVVVVGAAAAIDSIPATGVMA